MKLFPDRVGRPSFLGRNVHHLAKPGERSDPQHADGSDAAAHSGGGLLMGETLDVSQENNLGVIGGEARQGVRQARALTRGDWRHSLGEEIGAASASPRRRDDSARACSSETSRVMSRLAAPAK